MTVLDRYHRSVAEMASEFVLSLRSGRLPDETMIARATEIIDLALISPDHWEVYEAAVMARLAPLHRQQRGTEAAPPPWLRSLGDEELADLLRGPLEHRPISDIGAQIRDLALNLVALDEIRLAIRDEASDAWLDFIARCDVFDALREDLGQPSIGGEYPIAGVDGLSSDQYHESLAILRDPKAHSADGRRSLNKEYSEALKPIPTRAGELWMDIEDKRIEWEVTPNDPIGATGVLVRGWWGEINDKDVMKFRLLGAVRLQEGCRASVQMFNPIGDALSDEFEVLRDEEILVPMNRTRGFRVGDVLRLSFASEQPSYRLCVRLPIQTAEVRN